MLTRASVAASLLLTCCPALLDQRGEPSRASILRGEYGRYRANNDLLFYHLDIRVDPKQRVIRGVNTVRFRMLKDDARIQLDLHPPLKVDRVMFRGVALKTERELNTVWIDFPETLEAGRTYSIDFFYSGTPKQSGRFGGFTFAQDPAKRPWIFTACQGQGASCWWPCKDQWRDEVDSMEISLAVPNGLVAVANGAGLGRTDLGDGYSRWDWLVQYPINSYCVSINVASYERFSERLDDLVLDYYVLPEDLDDAKRQFAQAKGVLEAFEYWFGEYPFKRDGYKLIQVPYAGMEHQSAVTYGNGFTNGYGGRDWTGVGVSTKFDFIIVHETAHEWFGNAVSATDVADMWIHEGWGTYLEVLYVEHRFGRDDAIKYVNGYKSKVRNRTPIVTRRGIHATPSQDQYFKGALFLHTLRSIVDDDDRWRALLRELFDTFKYRNITTEDVVAFFDERTTTELAPIFAQYLRHPRLPKLELKFDQAENTMSFRWQADAEGFAMPVRVGQPGSWQVVTPTAEWTTMATSIVPDEFEVATDRYYIDVAR